MKEKTPYGYWTYERCYEAARKFNSASEFQKEYTGACYKARIKGWFKDYYWFPSVKPNGYWNYNTCFEAAKECSSKSEYFRKYSGAYRVANENGWFKDYVWFKTPVQKPHTESDYVIYSYEDRVNKAVYVGLSNNIRQRHNVHKGGQMRRGVRKFDTVAKYFQSIGKEMPNPVIKMDGLTAQQAQYYEGWYVDGYKRAGWTIINRGKTGENTSALGGTYVKWTYDKCKEEASKYKSRNSFQNGSVGAYQVSLKNKWLDDFTWLIKIKKENGYWNYERCYEEAKKYKTKSAYKRGNISAYDVALKNKWFDDYDWFLSETEARKEAYKNRKKKEVA